MAGPVIFKWDGVETRGPGEESDGSLPGKGAHARQLAATFLLLFMVSGHFSSRENEPCVNILVPDPRGDMFAPPQHSTTLASTR